MAKDDPLRDAARIFNYIEVGLWPVMGLILLVSAPWRKGAARRDSLIAGFTLMIFGASDYFEAENGNEWWRPWWLFLWKAICVLILLSVLIAAWRRTKRLRRQEPQTMPPPG